jgi:ATP-dependent DNA helicase UvrD/PcrA
VRLVDLSARQRQVVDAIEPVVVVFGGPGTGKTTTALWAGRLALERPDVGSWQRVLFLTFSRTAVGQIARRAPDVFGSTGTRIDIQTFHAFAWRLIRAFGRYSGHGLKPPSLESEARARLLGRDQTRLSYDDLIPAACKPLTSQRLLSLVRRRWPFVICDEFQDTNDAQWKLLTLLANGGRLLLLGDPNQMIYTFLKHTGVGPKRLEDAKRIATRVIDLESQSHRDPSGAIPAMAEAVRLRRFTDNAVVTALRAGRLTVIPNIADAALTKAIADEVARVRASGASTVGIFGHSNEGVAELGAALISSGLDHVLVGIPEAHGEALICLATLCAFAAGKTTWEEVRVQLATFLTACTRGKMPPDLAVQLSRGRALPRGFELRVAELERTLRDVGDGKLRDVLPVAATAWRGLGVTRGERPWQRASLDFVAMTRRFVDLPLTDASVNQLLMAAARRRAGVLVDFDSVQESPVQLMNFHQTKGREADAVLLVYRPGDYLAAARDSEPFDEPSRVLFVALSRARQTVAVILPPNPHPLVAPFLRALKAA